ncbi:hypothetical protein N7466_001152 [Penicillium verhagenii]|uniref:uncharacterized protein n=1 Tax=Penicillium verhagenii TaxID=1562060 RepID=UPI0025451027|nr:uncharacterized protein N7466_001152 [Penicillium verhagenii]KAJ5948137.1 hypothetical protein N7466_001152 [Penicillium verhagenii]
MDSPRRSRNRAACRRCQRRKIRCNGDQPQCSACKKANVSCVNDEKQQVNRTYIANLQRRVEWLESLVKEQTNIRLEDGPPLVLDETHQTSHSRGNQINLASTSQQVQSEHSARVLPVDPPPEQSRQAHEIGLVSLSAGFEPRYIGPSSGYFLANLVFSSAGRRIKPSKSQSTRNEPLSLSSDLFDSPTPLPTRKEDAIELSTKYFSLIHVMYPFLYEPSHMQRIDKMYSNGSTPDPIAAFHVNMVLAIAASDLSRRFRIRLPAEGYYTAATQFFEEACPEGSLDGLQSLLLLMVYALHNPSCGVDIWSLNYQCLGRLIDLGLQRDVRTSSAFPISFLQQEMRTRIFWVVYNFDRTLGTMMGRPIGVRDEACDLRFPSDVSDQDLGQTAPENPRSPSHMTYSIHLFKLARMNSEIKYVMHSICRDAPHYAYPPATNIHEWQRQMIDRLQDWLSGIPQVTGMDSIAKICETKYHEMMILLLRPSPGIPEPSEELFSRCFQHAVDLLRGFGELYRQEVLLYSRLVVHSIFLSTMIMLHCLCRLPAISSHVQIDDVVADTCIGLNILSSIGEYWTEAKRARDCIQELSNTTIQRLIRNRGLETSPHAKKTEAASVPTSGGNSRNQNANTWGEMADQVDSAVDLAAATEPLNDYQLDLDSTSWWNESTSGGFMDFAGVPDFDSLMWEVFNNT